MNADVKVRGLTGVVQWILRDESVEGVGGTCLVAVKGEDIRKNTGREGGFQIYK